MESPADAGITQETSSAESPAHHGRAFRVMMVYTEEVPHDLNRLTKDAIPLLTDRLA